jgi:tetratricopeptide (TPR) repeat protein
LQTARHIYLEWDLQYAAALADARALLASGDRSPEDREFLLDRESFNLCNLGRIDEARSRYDERIHDAKLPAKKLRLLGVKAEMISNRPGVSREEGNRAWREYRQAAKPGTNQWLTATWVLGVRLKRDGRYRDALTLFEEFLQATPKDSGILLQAAECNLALGNKEAARSRIHEAEAALPTSSPRQTDIEEVTNGRARIAKLKEQLGQPGK